MNNGQFMEGASWALGKASKYCERSGKTRSAEWLNECVQVVEGATPSGPWPEAPAYKGSVIHVEDRTKTALDLGNIADDQLIWLNTAVMNEMSSRLGAQEWT